MADNYSPGFVQRVLQMFSPIRAAQDVAQGFSTFSDIVNNRGVTDQQVESAGQTLGAVATPATLGRRPIAPQPIATPYPRAALSQMAPEVRAYGRGRLEARGRGVTDGDTFFLNTPELAQQHAAGFRDGFDRPRRLAPEAGREVAATPAPEPPTPMSPSPAPNPQQLGQVLQDSVAPQAAPKRSARFSSPDKDAVLYRMAEGELPTSFETAAQRKYAREMERTAKELGTTLQDMARMRQGPKPIRPRPWMLAPPAASAAASQDDEFRRALAEQLMPVY